MIIYLIRHGETDWNIDLKVQGQKDIPLNDNGINQAQILSDYFENIPIEAIYSSNLIRAYETAKIISKKISKDIIVIPQLQEINMGQWEGNLWDDLKIEYKDFIHNWENNLENIPIPDGESYGQVQKRILKAFRKIVDNHDLNSQIIIVSHGIAIKVLISYLIGLGIQNVHRFSIDNASISIIEVNDKECNKKIFKLKSLNNTFHLKRLGHFDTKKF